MAFRVSLLLLLLFNTILITSRVYARHSRLYERATLEELEVVKAGLLVKNNTQTSCSLGLLDSKAAFVSADCLDYTSGDKVNYASKYQVYINSGFDKTSAKHDVTKVTVHPGYNKQTKANNIALLQFNENSDTLWYNYNAISRDTWQALVYIQYSMYDVEQMQWSTLRFYTVSNTDDDDCADYSFLYKDNKKDFVCSSKVITDAPSSVSAVCSKAPYGIVYATMGEYSYPAGFLSHVVLKNADDLCGSGDARAYYTLFEDYLMFAADTMNRTAYFNSSDNSTRPQEDPGFAMKAPAGSVAGVQVLGGNMYARQGTQSTQSASIMSSSKPSASTDDDASQTDGTSSDNSAENSNNNNDKNAGSSNKTTVIAAVCSAIGAVLLAIGLFFFVRWYRKHGKIRRQRDPYSETVAQEMLANGLGGASIPAASGLESVPVPAARASTDLAADALFSRPPPTYADSAAAVSPASASVFSPFSAETPVFAMPVAPMAMPDAGDHHGFSADEKK
ncbi:hypothetical protein FB645_004747 [Coemansia sp. IMI 203386]|nr:hypothetical protein FB645_004747 [Coemansia sp. IMI 203386]